LRLAHVKFANQLRQIFPELNNDDYQGATVREVLCQVNQQHPGILDYLLDGGNSIRQHVNIFVNQKALDKKNGLASPLDHNATIHIFQAVSGG